jgi:hypothetical protein
LIPPKPICKNFQTRRKDTIRKVNLYFFIKKIKKFSKKNKRYTELKIAVENNIYDLNWAKNANGPGVFTDMKFLSNLTNSLLLLTKCSFENTSAESFDLPKTNISESIPTHL